MEEEEEPKTLSQSTFKEGENIESKDDESCASCSRLIVKSWNGEEGVSLSYVYNCRHKYKWSLSLNYKYLIFCRNFSSMSIVKNGTEIEHDDIINKKQLESIEVVSQYWVLFNGNN